MRASYLDKVGHAPRHAHLARGHSWARVGTRTGTEASRRARAKLARRPYEQGARRRSTAFDECTTRHIWTRAGKCFVTTRDTGAALARARHASSQPISHGSRYNLDTKVALSPQSPAKLKQWHCNEQLRAEECQERDCKESGVQLAEQQWTADRSARPLGPAHFAQRVPGRGGPRVEDCRHAVRALGPPSRRQEYGRRPSRWIQCVNQSYSLCRPPR